MSEEKAAYATESAFLEDPFGFIAIFAEAHAMSLRQGTHPTQAVEAAYHAVKAYRDSHDFVEVGHKGSEGLELRMVPKRESKVGSGLGAKPQRGR